MGTFREYILETDKNHFEGEITRGDDFKIIKVGNFEVGKSASFITPVRKETSDIIRFENSGSWAVFSGGRVEVQHLIGWKPNPNYQD